MLTFFMKSIESHHVRFTSYDAITGMSKIARRYFVMNSFDGVLTIIGLLIGSYVSGLMDGAFIFKVGLGVAIALSISGLSGALMTERAERLSEIKAMEKALHRSLNKSDMRKAYDYATLLTSLVNSLSPLAMSLLLLSPFLFLSAAEAYPASFLLAFVSLISLGAFLGMISKENLVISALKFLAAGILCLVLIVMIESIAS